MQAVVMILAMTLLLTSTDKSEPMRVQPVGTIERSEPDERFPITEACNELLDETEPPGEDNRRDWERARRICWLFLLLSAPDDSRLDARPPAGFPFTQ